MLNVFIYIISINLLILLYVGGIYLLLLGQLALIFEGNIYVGFLWVIDLGVGLVFLIFILHYTPFLYQKSVINVFAKNNIYMWIFALVSIFWSYYSAFANDTDFSSIALNCWYFLITYLDYYNIKTVYEVTDLNIMRDTYFLWNACHFILVNFSLLYGLLSAIVMYFNIQRIFNHLNLSQILNSTLINKVENAFFIKLQDYVTQQNTVPSVVASMNH